jgi:hypothetical protein
MLKKMLIQGLVGAALIGGAAAGYAQVQDGSRDNGYLAAPARDGRVDRDRDDDRKDRRVGEHRERQGERDQARLERHGHGQGRDHDRDDH